MYRSGLFLGHTCDSILNYSPIEGKQIDDDKRWRGIAKERVSYFRENVPMVFRIKGNEERCCTDDKNLPFRLETVVPVQRYKSSARHYRSIYFVRVRDKLSMPSTTGGQPRVPTSTCEYIIRVSSGVVATMKFGARPVGAVKFHRYSISAQTHRLCNRLLNTLSLFRPSSILLYCAI